MQLTEKHREYWRRNLNLTGILLLIWFLVTFALQFFAIPLEEISFFGFPVAFYMGAQGALIIYVLIIWFYARRMGRLDQEYNVAEGD
jgi:putative solute:sodium symporter small subunit